MKHTDRHYWTENAAADGQLPRKQLISEHFGNTESDVNVTYIYCEICYVAQLD